MTLRITQPLPRLEDCVDLLGERNIYSKTGCNSRYLQTEIPEEDCARITFSTRQGSFCFVPIQLELKSASASFQEAIAVRPLTVEQKFAPIYLSRTIIYSNSATSHLGHARTVLALSQNDRVTVE